MDAGSGVDSSLYQSLGNAVRGVEPPAPGQQRAQGAKKADHEALARPVLGARAADQAGAHEGEGGKALRLQVALELTLTRL